MKRSLRVVSGFLFLSLFSHTTRAEHSTTGTGRPSSFGTPSTTNIYNAVDACNERNFESYGVTPPPSNPPQNPDAPPPGGGGDTSDPLASGIAKCTQCHGFKNSTGTPVAPGGSEKDIGNIPASIDRMNQMMTTEKGTSLTEEEKQAILSWQP